MNTAGRETFNRSANFEVIRMKRLTYLCLLTLLCGCPSSELTAPQICEAVCKKLTSCPGMTGQYQDCVKGFGCAQQTAPADCEQSCLSLPSCSVEYAACRERCLSAQSTCAASCASCASGEVCFGGLVPNTSIVEFSATCRKSCTSDDDCASNEKCVQEVSIAGRLAGPVCLPSGVARCDQSVIGVCNSPPTCLDGETLLKNYFDSPSVCGSELIHCPNGCEGATADGGIPDGGVAGHCR